MVNSVSNNRIKQIGFWLMNIFAVGFAIWMIRGCLHLVDSEKKSIQETSRNKALLDKCAQNGDLLCLLKAYESARVRKYAIQLMGEVLSKVGNGYCSQQATAPTTESKIAELLSVVSKDSGSEYHDVAAEALAVAVRPVIEAHQSHLVQLCQAAASAGGVGRISKAEWDGTVILIDGRLQTAQFQGLVPCTVDRILSQTPLAVCIRKYTVRVGTYEPGGGPANQVHYDTSLIDVAHALQVGHVDLVGGLPPKKKLHSGGAEGVPPSVSSIQEWFVTLKQREEAARQ